MVDSPTPFRWGNREVALLLHTSGEYLGVRPHDHEAGQDWLWAVASAHCELAELSSLNTGEDDDANGASGKEAPAPTPTTGSKTN